MRPAAVDSSTSKIATKSGVTSPHAARAASRIAVWSNPPAAPWYASVDDTNRSATTQAPRSKAGRMRDATNSARLAMYSSISVRTSISPVSGSSKTARRRSPSGVPPGSRTSTTSSPASRNMATNRAAWVDFPDPSGPSTTTNLPDKSVNHGMFAAGRLTRNESFPATAWLP